MSNDKGVTRHLGMPSDAKPMPQRPTSPLDTLVPWVIEFRVVGTAHLIQVSARENMIIGRGDPRHGVIADVDLTPYAAHVLGVSRQHASVSVLKDRVVIKDMNSANGTFLNGHVLTPGEDYRLRHGDQLSFGQLHLQVQFVVTPGDQENATVEIPIIGGGQYALVVDDDGDVARLLGSILEKAGFEVRLASNAVEALNKMTEKLPNVLIFELVLPDMNGLDLARYVRRQPEGHRVPMIALSAASGGFHTNQAREAGVNIVLTKPVGIDSIIEAVRSTVSGL